MKGPMSSEETSSLRSCEKGVLLVEAAPVGAILLSEPSRRVCNQITGPRTEFFSGPPAFQVVVLCLCDTVRLICFWSHRRSSSVLADWLAYRKHSFSSAARARGRSWPWRCPSRLDAPLPPPLQGTRLFRLQRLLPEFHFCTNEQIMHVS